MLFCPETYNEKGQVRRVGDVQDDGGANWTSFFPYMAIILKPPFLKSWIRY